MSTIIDNKNRFHAVKLIKKSLNLIKSLDEEGEIAVDEDLDDKEVSEICACNAVANAIVYTGDQINSLVELLKERDTNFR